PRPVHELDPLGTVVGEDRDVVLPGLPRLEIGALATAAETEPSQRPADATGAPGPLRARERPVAPHDRLAVADVAGEKLLEEREVHEHGGRSVTAPRREGEDPWRLRS